MVEKVDRAHAAMLWAPSAAVQSRFRIPDIMVRNADPRPAWDLTQLRTFVAVAQEGHLTRAAERLHVSQPAASAHIRALERFLDIALFVRTNRGLELTAAGRRLADCAEHVLGQAAGLDSLARELRGSIGGRLRLGTNADPSLSKLGALVSRLRERYPLLELDVQMRSSLATSQGVLAGELDAGFLLGVSLETGLTGLRLARLGYRITGPAAWAAELDTSDLRALAALPWVTTAPGTSNHEMREAIFRPLGLAVNATVETNNDLVLRSLVADGVGVGMIREDFAEAGRRNGVYALPPVGPGTTFLQFVYPTRVPDDPIIAAARALVLEMWPHAAAAGSERHAMDPGSSQ